MVDEVQSVRGNVNRRMVLAGTAALGAVRWGMAQPIQVERTAAELREVRTPHLHLLSDATEEQVIEMGRVFEAALPAWADYFGVPRSSLEGAVATLYCLRDHQRFDALQVIPAEIPRFRQGYQWGDQLFMLDQPSDYYRRHLMLHEGTHWFMWKFLQASGPPWYSEGCCEWLATHAWDGDRLTVATIPTSDREWPYWGRLKVIRDALEAGQASRLRTILAYGDTTHRTDDPYAWSWAAVLFLSHHPLTAHWFTVAGRRGLEDAASWQSVVVSEYNEHRAMLEAAWAGFLGELDYGYDPERQRIQLDWDADRPLEQNHAVEVAADRGWQASGVRVEAGQVVSIAARGQIVVCAADNPASRGVAWPAQPDGITLRYVGGQPLGRLMAAVVGRPDDDAAHVQPWTISAVGSAGQLTAARAGSLFLKINEAVGEHRDNQGAYQVEIQ